MHMVRYADDFIITGNSKEWLEHEVKPAVVEFLAERGLVLSPEKTKITHIREGFDFLGWNIRKYHDKLLTKPSKANIKAHLDKIREVINGNKTAKQANLMVALSTGDLKQCPPICRYFVTVNRQTRCNNMRA